MELKMQTEQQVLREEDKWRQKNSKFIEIQVLRATIICDAERLKNLKGISSNVYKAIISLIKS